MVSPELQISEAGLLLTLEKGCIETTAQRAHKALCDALLSQDSSPQEDQDALELLRQFLENTDFKTIRTHHPDLAQASGQRISISRDTDGKPVWTRVE